MITTLVNRADSGLGLAAACGAIQAQARLVGLHVPAAGAEDHLPLSPDPRLSAHYTLHRCLDAIEYPDIAQTPNILLPMLLLCWVYSIA